MHVAPLVPYDPRDNSFPSDHALATAYVASFLFFVDARWAVFASLVALFVGLARVLALLHWPQDVLVGWAIGAWCGAVAGVLSPRSADVAGHVETPRDSDGAGDEPFKPRRD